MFSTRFRDRTEAGKQLAKKLLNWRDNPNNVVVLGLPRGGVVLAYEVARALRVPLDIVVPRKIGCPFHEEYAVGALTEDGDVYLNQRALDSLGLSKADLQETIHRETLEAARRLKAYRGDLPPRQFEGKTVILVDDGIATGSTMMASINAVRQRNAKEIVVAVPVMPLDRVSKFEAECDKLVFIAATADFHAVGQYYDLFEQTTDDIVVDLLREARSIVPQQS